MSQLGARIAIVASQFNAAVTEKLLSGALQRLAELNFPEKNITVIKVPGAIEIPLATQLLAKSKNFAAIICLGAVIRGETGHYIHVCEQVSQGCQQVMMSFDVPVIFGVLTTDNAQQAFDRAGGNKGNKGREAAEAAWEMLDVVQSIAKYESRHCEEVRKTDAAIHIK